MLHILLNSPFKCDFNSFLKMIKKKDAVILIQDGVIAGIKNTKKNKKLLNKSQKTFILYEDIYARGLINDIEKKIIIINYNDFVNLTIKFLNQITW